MISTLSLTARGNGRRCRLAAEYPGKQLSDYNSYLLILDMSLIIKGRYLKC